MTMIFDKKDSCDKNRHSREMGFVIIKEDFLKKKKLGYDKIIIYLEQ